MLQSPDWKPLRNPNQLVNIFYAVDWSIGVVQEVIKIGIRMIYFWPVFLNIQSVKYENTELIMDHCNNTEMSENCHSLMHIFKMIHLWPFRCCLTGTFDYKILAASTSFRMPFSTGNRCYWFKYVWALNFFLR